MGKESKVVIYNNEMTTEEGADPITFLTKGAIKVHTGQQKGKPTSVQETSTINATEQSSSSFAVYPNPIQSDGFYISFPSATAGEIFEANIYDYNGRLLIQHQFEAPAGGGEVFWNLDHSGWDQGVYILKLISSAETFEFHLMKN